MHDLVPRIAIPVLAIACSAHLSAQCSTEWLAGNGLPGTNATNPAIGVRASTMWDPDGAGPVPPRVVIGGAFTIAVETFANGLAAWDPVADTWSPLGSGINDVRALATSANGDLIAAGSFTTAGGVAANNIARFDGTSWWPLGSGTDGTVSSLTTLPNGDLVAAGAFTTAGGVAANNIARFDGTSWWPLGSGVGGPTTVVEALATLANGDIVAGGTFSIAGGVAAARIARWDGAVWSPMGSGMNNEVRALATLANGDLVAGGFFTTAGGLGANRVARWDGISWSPLGSGIEGSPFFGQIAVVSLAELPNGDLLVGGSFPIAGGLPARYVARWNGTNWSAMGVPNHVVKSLTVLPSGDVLATGTFTIVGGVRMLRIARFDGTAWQPIGNGIEDWTWALAQLPNGDVVAGGYASLARRNGGTWVPYGLIPDDEILDLTASGAVFAFDQLPNGDLIVGGVFTRAAGVPANRIARFDGTTWHPFGTGLAGPIPQVFGVDHLPNGDILVAGEFTTAGGTPALNVARWNGTAWSALGAGVNNQAHVVRVLSNGDVIVGGIFTTAGGVPAPAIARWDGAAWHSLGSGLTLSTPGYVTVNAVVERANGELVVGGAFDFAGGAPAANVASWNGSSWSPLGAGVGDDVRAMIVLPDGDLVVGGTFTTAGGAPANRIARWDGSSWTPFGSGMDSDVIALTTLANGNVMAAGMFTSADGMLSAHVAELTTTCPAIATAFGNGCVSSGGNNTLAATTLPWVDATFHATGTGLPTVAIVIAATSVTPIAQGAAPLSVLLPPQGQPGCDLLVQPDILEAMVTLTGSAQSTLFLPSTPPLVGVVFWHQMVPIELDGVGNWVAITSTNALQLTAGAF